MELSRRELIRVLGASVVVAPFVLEGCSSSSSSSTSAASSSAASTSSAATASSAGAAATTVAGGSVSGSLALGRGGWSYDDTNDVYYQLGRAYAATPAATDYETLGIYVPGSYLSGAQQSDGTYTIELDAAGAVGAFTAATAPIVMPVNTPGYSAQRPPTSYSYDAVASYMEAGFIYVAAGMRGKDSQTSAYTGNAPWGVTDLKAAVRFLRYNAADLPGAHDQIYVFGMSGGGAQSTVIGASGDSPLYTPYLESIGAAMTDADGNDLSDAVAGVMAWCPITSLDLANAAYEWNMGQFASTGTRADGTWTKAYSLDLADTYAEYINGIGLVAADGSTLTLESSADGSYLAGSYHDHVLGVVETSLNDFLAVATFPYTPSMSGGMGGGAPGGGAPGGGGGLSSSSSATTYDTVQDYIDSLNSAATWVDYDASTATAKVLSLGGFVASQKNASKDVGAFDGIDRQATENVVFGLGTDGLHFDEVARDVIAAGESEYVGLDNWDSTYPRSTDSVLGVRRRAGVSGLGVSEAWLAFAGTR